RRTLLWTAARRELSRRPGRTALTLAGIAVGVAAFVAIATGSRVTQAAYGDMFAAVAGRAALEVVAPDQLPFKPDLDSLKSLGHVEPIPIVQAPSALRTASGPVPLLVMAVDPARD